MVVLDVNSKLLAAQAVLGLLAWGYYWRSELPASEKYDTLFPRLWGGIIDSVLLSPVVFVYFAFTYFGWSRLGLAVDGTLRIALPLIYSAMLLAKHGRTVGLRVTRVCLVDSRSESPVTPRQAWWREGVFVLPVALQSAAILYLYLVECVELETPTAPLLKDHPLYFRACIAVGLWGVVNLIVMLCNDKRRSVVDYLAGTVLIRTNLSAEAANETPTA